jgi:hypothetical protein
MCRDEGAWTSEDIFPHTYNPKVGSQRVSIAGAEGGLPILDPDVSGRGSLDLRGHLPPHLQPQGRQHLSIVGAKGGLPILDPDVSGRGSLDLRGHLPPHLQPQGRQLACTLSIAGA